MRRTQFPSSNLPEVQVRIENAGQVCDGPLALFDAPLPRRSSEPEDIDPADLSEEYRNR